jgi:Na+:H+ antiporter, NhaB family
MGSSPNWYKLLIISFLVINPFLFEMNSYLAGWVLVVEFIFTLGMALKCYPLIPGGLLSIQALIIGMTNTKTLHHELVSNIEVILLLVFMVAGIYFLQSLLMFLFTKLFITVRNKRILSLSLSLSCAFLSAFLDALTVIAVMITVIGGFYAIYHKTITSNKSHPNIDKNDAGKFRSFLTSLIMHAAIGTALGGVCTMVGEPQNLIIANKAGWDFMEFVLRMSPVTIATLLAGLVTCYILEKFKIFGYGAEIPEDVYQILLDDYQKQVNNRTKKDIVNLVFQGLIAVWLILGLAFHLADVGMIGLSVIILAITFQGITEEHQIGKAFEEALPFTCLLCVFFVIVSVIIDLQLFTPIITYVLTSFEGNMQLVMFFGANGLLSMVSDNVFVGTVYMNEITSALSSGQITRDQFDMLAVAINTGTNLPSVATPNGQAAFLFLLTSALGPILHLSYGKMVKMAFPYTIVLTIVGILMVIYNLEPMTQQLYDAGLINHHVAEATEGINSNSHH